MVGGRVVAEDDVVDRDAKVEAAFFVEVDDLARGVGRHVVPDVTERAAVAHGQQSGSGCGVEAEEFPDSCPVQAVALRQGVLPRGARESVHDGLGHQEAVDDVPG